MRINKGYGFGILQGLAVAEGRILSWTHADLQTDPKDVVLAYELYKVELGNVAQVKLKGVKPTLQILLKEDGQFLHLEPLYAYNDIIVQMTDGPTVIQQMDEKIVILERDLASERTLMNEVQQLHSGFIRYDQGNKLSLKGAEVLKNNWFFLFIDTLRERQIPLFGTESLKQYKFNTAKPATRLYISSNTDWFDAKVEISFGD